MAKISKDGETYSISELIGEYGSEEKEVKNKAELKSWFEDDKLYVGGYVKCKIDQLDEPEVLSQEWIDENAYAVAYDGMPDETEVVYVDDLQNLLVPKQEEVDRADKDGYEKRKEHATRDDEPETVASVMAGYFGAMARLKEVLAMEVEELENDDD